jgi:hypothetical protein
LLLPAFDDFRFKQPGLGGRVVHLVNAAEDDGVEDGFWDAEQDDLVDPFGCGARGKLGNDALNFYSL